jgi:hypothetical protein
MPTARRPRTDFARRVDLYVLAALPADHQMAPPDASYSLSAGALYEHGLDHLETRNRAEAEAVERIVREAGL